MDSDAIHDWSSVKIQYHIARPLTEIIIIGLKIFMSLSNSKKKYFRETSQLYWYILDVSMRTKDRKLYQNSLVFPLVFCFNLIPYDNFGGV
jgi:hypothetical protein